jgi:hypothetical protein
MGCCTSLLYEMTGAGKNTVKATLTAGLLRSQLRRRQLSGMPSCAMLHVITGVPLRQQGDLRQTQGQFVDTGEHAVQARLV